MNGIVYRLTCESISKQKIRKHLYREGDIRSRIVTFYHIVTFKE